MRSQRNYANSTRSNFCLHREIQQDMSKRKLGDVYNHFERDGDTRRGLCKQEGCGESIFWKSSNLKKHLEAKHSEVFRQLMSLEKVQSSNNTFNESLESRETTALIESSIAQVFFHCHIPFEFADSEQWKQMIRLLNPSYAAKMPKASELERKYSESGGNCLVCQSSLSGKRKSLRNLIGSKDIRLHEVLESWTGKAFYEEEKDSYSVCIKCFSKVEKFYEQQESCQEIQSEIVSRFSQNQCERVLIKQEPELDCSLHPNTTTVWTSTFAEPMNESEEEVEGFECDFCGLQFYNRPEFLDHMKTHSVNKTNFRCETCPKNFKNEHLLEFHQLTDHEKQTSSFECPICFKTDSWTRLRDFCRHFMKHKQERTLCTICGTSLNRRSVIRHMRIHDDVRPFPCEYPDCISKSFRSAAALKIHLQTHTGEKNFQCQHCCKAFFSESGLRNHIKNHHSLDQGIKVKCHICGSGFESRYKVKRHLKNVHHVASE